MFRDNCWYNCQNNFLTRKLSYRKDDRAMRPIYGCPENFRESLSMPKTIFREIFNELLTSVPIEPINVRTKFEVRSFTRSWDNRGYPKNFGSLWIRPRSLFTKIFNGFCSHGPYGMYWPNLKSVALPVPEIIVGTGKKFGQSLDTPTFPFIHFLWAFVRMDPVIVLVKFEVRRFTVYWDHNSDWNFGWGCEPQSWGIGWRKGPGMVPFERALVSSYRPYILHSNFSSIFTRFRDAAFVLQHATFSHPISSLPKISPCSPDSRWMALGLRRAKVLG